MNNAILVSAAWQLTMVTKVFGRKHLLQTNNVGVSDFSPGIDAAHCLLLGKMVPDDATEAVRLAVGNAKHFVHLRWEP